MEIFCKEDTWPALRSAASPWTTTSPNSWSR